MRYYYREKKLHQIPEESCDPEGFRVEVMTVDQYQKRFRERDGCGTLLRSLYNIRYCKADVSKNCVTGTFYCPDKKNLIKKTCRFGYYIDRDQVIFIDCEGAVETVLKKISENTSEGEGDAPNFFLGFLEYLVKDDIFFLQEYEKKLAELEDSLYDVSMEDVTHQMMRCRRELLCLTSYYHQLLDMSEVLRENVNSLFTEQETASFALFSGRVERLYDNAQVLREYALQIRELYQAQIDIRQNKIMQFLTVVTTIFLPLTLITGWYGMNFAYMPELAWKKSYFVLIGISVGIILLELWYFKRKNWF